MEIILEFKGSDTIDELYKITIKELDKLLLHTTAVLSDKKLQELDWYLSELVATVRNEQSKRFLAKSE